MVRTFVGLLACAALAACATPESSPTARPLSAASMQVLGATPASVSGSQLGVGKSWFYTEVNGGGAGLAGAIGGAIAAAIINAAPSARAHRQATEIAEAVTPQWLDQSLAAKLRAQASAPAPGPVTIGDVSVANKVAAPGELDDVLEIATTYTLSEDSSVLRVAATATYKNPQIPYKTPYAFQKQVPKSETTGPLYRNVFTYYSTPLPLPTLTPELKARLVASVQESVRDDSGALPVEGTKEFRAMTHEIELAQDDKLTGGESSVFLTREWLKDDAAPLKREIERAHDFIAKYLVLDVNRAAVPSMTGADELLETAADDRTVRRLGEGVQAGSYVSSAANVEAPPTFGNAVAVGKPTQEYVASLKRQAKGSK